MQRGRTLHTLRNSQRTRGAGEMQLEHRYSRLEFYPFSLNDFPAMNCGATIPPSQLRPILSTVNELAELLRVLG